MPCRCSPHATKNRPALRLARTKNLRFALLRFQDFQRLRGRFQSVSEVVRAGLRKLEEDEAKLNVLRRKLQAGEDSQQIENFNEEDFLSAMHKKYTK